MSCSTDENIHHGSSNDTLHGHILTDYLHASIARNSSVSQAKLSEVNLLQAYLNCSLSVRVWFSVVVAQDGASQKWSITGSQVEDFDLTLSA